MFDTTSRYFNLKIATISVPDDQAGGVREIRYVRRRIIPSSKSLTTLVEHTVAQGERLDNITARYLGDPTQFWRICDANDALQPEELEETGRVIKIALPNI
jgi:hypothetical protein